MNRIVLAYSGGLDTSVAIPWLAGTYGADVVAVTLDLGQGGPLEDVRDRALAAGALRAHVLDVREEFARDYVLPSLKADAVRRDGHPMGTALGRPLLARKLVEIAAIEQAAAVAHGCAGTGDDRARVENAARATNPAIVVIAPVHDWGMTRPEKIEYARARGIPVPAAVDRPCRTDTTLWGRSIECGAPDDPWTEPPEAIYALTRPPRDCPDEAASVEIAFDRGVPTAINGVTMPLVELVGSLDIIAGAHGVGRIEGVQTRPAGARAREICEAPAAVVLHRAHKDLRRTVSGRDADRFSRVVSGRYADLVHDGLWFTPLRDALDAYVGALEERVTGVVRLKLFKGDCRIVGRTSPFAVYDETPPAHDASDAPDRRAIMTNDQRPTTND